MMASIRHGPGSCTARAKALREGLGGIDAHGRHAHAARERDEVERRARRGRASTARAARAASAPTRLQLHVQDRVGAVRRRSPWSRRAASRACVQSACSVYIALPSASRQTTLRSGQATAAPVASGMPWPIAPPVRREPACGGAPAVGQPHEQARGVALVRRRSRPRAGARRSRRPSDFGVSAPVGSRGRCAGCEHRRLRRRATASASCSSAATRVVLGTREHMHLAARRGTR